jgi:hypothetical protein
MTSQASIIKATIEVYAEHLRQHDRLLALAKRGGVGGKALALYLESLRYLFMQSQRNLGLAAERSEQLGDDALARYFAQKASEEQGHDAWAQADLASLPRELTEGVQPSRAVVALTHLQRALIDEHPICFVVYALWAEYFTVLMGDEWLDALQASGHGRDRVSAVAKHVDADRAHAALGIAELDRLYRGQVEPSRLLFTVAQAGELFQAFCEDVFREAVRAA